MTRLQELINEINKLTSTIEQEYPGLYQFLDEMPISIPNRNHPNVDTKILCDYLESLNQLLKHHIESHQNAQNKENINE